MLGVLYHDGTSNQQDLVVPIDLKRDTAETLLSTVGPDQVALVEHFKWKKHLDLLKRLLAEAEELVTNAYREQGTNIRCAYVVPNIYVLIEAKDPDSFRAVALTRAIPISKERWAVEQEALYRVLRQPQAS